MLDYQQHILLHSTFSSFGMVQKILIFRLPYLGQRIVSYLVHSSGIKLGHSPGIKIASLLLLNGKKFKVTARWKCNLSHISAQRIIKQQSESASQGEKYSCRQGPASYNTLQSTTVLHSTLGEGYSWDHLLVLGQQILQVSVLLPTNGSCHFGVAAIFQPLVYTSWGDNIQYSNSMRLILSIFLPCL